MRLYLLAMATALSLLAQAPQPAANPKELTIAQLQAKITTLEAQLAKANASLKRLSLRAQYEQQICSLPEMAQAIVEDAAADAKVKALPKEPK